MINTPFTEEFTEAPDVDQKGAVPLPPEAKELWQLESDPFGDPNELLENRFLCRGGGMLLVGPTGIGKSSFVLQCALMWANGEPAFGIRPAIPLRVLIIQAENDEGDMAEMRDGVKKGLQIPPDEFKHLAGRIIVVNENTRTGATLFWATVEPLLKKYQPDILIIDPALAYLGGDTNSQQAVGLFLRNQLNPLLTKYNCGCIVVHHTNKPPSGREKPNWQAGDFAYFGSGSAEWSNWARAVLVIRNTGSNDVYELRAPKRGGRLGWRDAEGKKVHLKYIAHAKEPGKIYWRDADASEIPADAEQMRSPEDIVLSLIPTTGTVLKASLLSRIGVHGVGQNKARDILKDLVARKLVFEHEKPRQGNRPEIYLSRSAEPPKYDGPVATVVTTGKTGGENLKIPQTGSYNTPLLYRGV